MERIQQHLVNQGYNLGNYGPNKDGVDGSPGKVTYSAMTKYIKKLCKDNGYTFFQHNLYWFRMSDEFTDKFSDFVAVVKGGECVFIEVATTKPGKYWINNPVTVGGITGTGIQKAGQYLNSHKFIAGWSKWNGLGYFKQIGTILVHRDGNKDNILNKNIVQKAPSWFGFFLHSMGKGFSIWNWSAGCLGSPAKSWARVIKFFKSGDIVHNTIFEV